MVGMQLDDDDEEIRQPDTWEIIRKYFDENGLVQQQRASYNEFILQNIQEVIEDYKGQIEVTASQQYMPGQKNNGRIKMQVEFGKVRIAQPKIQENDGRNERMLPYMGMSLLTAVQRRENIFLGLENQIETIF
jgi:DNA-directed RNA polymerase II subunit RPB2